MKKFLYFLILFASLAKAFGDNFRAKDYSYLIQKMPDFDPKVLQIHFKLYEGYVEQVNKLDGMRAEALSKSINGQPFTFQSIQKQYTWEYDSMVLHELYFDNLGGDGQLSPKSEIARRIQKQFGSIDAWKSDFEQVCLTRGIGWVVLYLNPKTGEMKNIWIGEHSEGPLVSSIPILVVDLWEHAYLCQFGRDRKQYLQLVWKYMNWDVVNKRLL